MRCEDARRYMPLLEEDADGAGAPTRAEILRHLAACRACEAHRTEMARVSALVRASAVALVPEEALERVAAGVAAGLAHGGRPWAGFRWGAWWASVERSPVPRLLEAAVLVWGALLLTLQLPGAGPALRAIWGF